VKSAVLSILLLVQVSGIVLKRGPNIFQPLSNARVELLDGPTAAVVRTDGAGRFVFDAVRPGRYRVKVTRDGFVRQDYGQRLPNGPAFFLDVSATKGAEDLVFLMQPAPTISGWVRDEYGLVVPGMPVEAYRKGYDSHGRHTLTLMASTLSDDRGQYRLYWLDPGDYIVRSGSGPAGSIYLPTYYPGFDDPTAAETVSLRDHEVDGVDFKVIHGFPATIDGTVVLSQGGFAGASITLQLPGHVMSPFRYQATASPQGGRGQGVFTLNNVAPGTYVAAANQTIGGRGFSGRVQFVLPNGKSVPIYHLRVVMAPNVEVTGSVTCDSCQTDLNRLQVQLTASDSTLPAIDARVARDGSFAFANVAAGEYAVSFSGLPQDAYIEDAPDSLQVEPGASPKPIRMSLGLQGGTITGAVHDSAGQSRFGVQVVAIPDRADAPAVQSRIVTSAPDGSFTLRGLAPGSYKLFAWEVVEPNAYLDPAFVKNYDASAVHLSVPANRTVFADLLMISADP
jgi:hypothetical protein